MRNIKDQIERNKENGRPDNYKTLWSLEDLIVVANTLPTVHNRKMLAQALKRTEAAIDYVWYDLQRSKKSWKMEFPDTYKDNTYINNLQKARKIVGLTRVFTP